MLLKENILRDIENIENPKSLKQISEYIRVIKQADAQTASNHDKVMKFAGILKNSEAKKISDIVSKEFEKNEGEW